MAPHRSHTTHPSQHDHAWSPPPFQPASRRADSPGPVAGSLVAQEADFTVAASPGGCCRGRLAGCVALSHGIFAPCGASEKTAAGNCRCCINVGRCRVVWRLVRELFTAACDRDLPEAAARRRPRCHMRQIAMYLSHVVLSVPYQTIATAFDRDRTTVTHACSVVEDRRDDPGYDRFVEQCERCITAVFAPWGQDHAEF